MTDTPGEPQADKFCDLARELEMDEDKAQLDETPRKVALTKRKVGTRTAFRPQLSTSPG